LLQKLTYFYKYSNYIQAQRFLQQYNYAVFTAHNKLFKNKIPAIIKIDKVRRHIPLLFVKFID